jgi:hypothetical protein
LAAFGRRSVFLSDSNRKLTSLAEVWPEPIRWLWPDRIPLGTITILEGDPGLGKSSIMHDLIGRLTKGRPMPNCQHAQPPAGVVLLQAEDHLAGTVQPNLQAAGADLSRVFIYDSCQFGDQPFRVPEDVQLVETAVGEVQARLLVLDPATAFLNCSINGEQSVRRALRPLQDLARRKGLAVLLVRHLVKHSSTSVLYRGAGSIALVAAARSGLRVFPDPTATDPHQHLLVQVKTNLAHAASLAFRTRKTGSAIAVEWLGEVPYSAQDLAGGPGEEHAALHEAMEVLYSLLAEGPVAANEVLQKAGKAGVSRRTLQRAKVLLRVRSRKSGNGPGSSWSWELPTDPALLQAMKEMDIDDLAGRFITPPTARPRRKTSRRAAAPRGAGRRGQSGGGRQRR